MHPDTLAFIDGLFGRCPVPEQTFITLTALPPERKYCATPSRHILLSDRNRLIQALEDLEATNLLGWGACIGVAPRRSDLGRYRRGGKFDLLELPALFVDVDRPLEQITELASFPIPPSCIVSSGLGIHLYWYLKEPTFAFESADRALRRLAKCFNGDHLAPAQSLRLPGTLNHKRGRNGARCHLLEYHSERHYNLTDFLDGVHDPPQDTANRRLPSTRPHVANNSLVQAITDTLFRRYDAYLKPNGWIAARCPAPHKHDFPGSHFYWNPALKMGHCYGVHQRLLLRDLKALLHL